MGGKKGTHFQEYGQYGVIDLKPLLENSELG